MISNIVIVTIFNILWQMFDLSSALAYRMVSINYDET